MRLLRRLRSLPGLMLASYRCRRRDVEETWRESVRFVLRSAFYYVRGMRRRRR